MENFDESKVKIINVLEFLTLQSLQLTKLIPNANPSPSHLKVQAKATNQPQMR